MTGRVWDIAEELSHATGVKAKRADVVARFVAEGGNAATASTQYGHWSRSRGGSDPTLGSKAESRLALGADEGGIAETVPASKPDWKVLLKNGFTYTSDWHLANSGTLLIDRPPPDAPGVYVFVVDDEVVYVGLTGRKLAARMNDYRLGHPGQKTSSRIKKRIEETLAVGTTVRLLCAVPADSTWNGLPVVMAAGLEAGLIAMFRPKWNMRGLGAAVAS